MMFKTLTVEAFRHLSVSQSDGNATIFYVKRDLNSTIKLGLRLFQQNLTQNFAQFEVILKSATKFRSKATA